VRAAEAAVAQWSPSADFYATLGHALLLNGQNDAAQTALERALQLNPNHLGALPKLADLLAGR
jgi:Tfp pilus assembly protein PilF